MLVVILVVAGGFMLVGGGLQSLPSPFRVRVGDDAWQSESSPAAPPTATTDFKLSPAERPPATPDVKLSSAPPLATADSKVPPATRAATTDWWPNSTLDEAVGRPWARDPNVFGAFYREPGHGGPQAAAKRVKWGTTIWAAMLGGALSQTAARAAAAFPAETVAALQAFRTKKGGKVVVVSADGEMIMMDDVAYQRQDISRAMRSRKAKAFAPGGSKPVPATLRKVSAADAHKALLAQSHGGKDFGTKTRLVNSTWM